MIFIKREESLQNEMANYIFKLERLNVFYDQVESGVISGRVIKLSIPNESIDDTFLVSTVDARTYTISLKSVTGRTIMTDELINLIIKNNPDYTITLIQLKNDIQKQ